MIKSNESSQDVFSMLGNLCIPMINQVVKNEWLLFFNEIEEVLEKKDLNYLVKNLSRFNIFSIEELHHQLNLNLVELTYAYYEIWIENLSEELKENLILDYGINQELIDETKGLLLAALENNELVNLYRKCESLEVMKQKLLTTKIVDKYKDNIIYGNKKDQETLVNKISYTFKTLHEYFLQLDADPKLLEYIVEYEAFCFCMNDRMNEMETFIENSKQNFIQTCINVFNKPIELIDEVVKNKKEKISLVCTKVNLLQFLQTMVVK